MSLRCGIASVPHDHCDQGGARGTPDGPPAETLVGQPALDVGRWVHSDDGVQAAIGMAALNSLIEPDQTRCRPINARDLLVDHAAGRKVAMIGHFPFVDALRAAAGEFWVLELRPRPGDLSADQAPAILPQADVIAITGVTLLNHTFDQLMALRRPDAYVVLLGGTVPLSPVFFDYGVDAIAGTIVDAPALTMRDIAAGKSFRQLEGKRPVIMLR